MIPNSKTTFTAGVVLATTLFASAASAAAVAGAAGTPAKPTPAHTPQSIECSKQADAKGLHGKERESFRSTCKHNLGKTTQVVPPAPAAPTK